MNPRYTRPIGYYYSSKTNPLTPEVEAYLERLPAAQKVLLATALLNKMDPRHNHPIGYYYSSKTNPMPAEVEAYLERLPAAQKILLPTALLNQCHTVFADFPTLSIARPTLTNDTAP
jgi:hypothetical protein